jgi:hypothetical protein
MMLTVSVKKFLTFLMGKVKYIHRPSAKTHLTVDFHVYLLVGSTIKVSRDIRHI